MVELIKNSKNILMHGPHIQLRMKVVINFLNTTRRFGVEEFY